MLCVVALDYLSTLAYQPSIAYNAAGLLAPGGDRRGGARDFARGTAGLPLCRRPFASRRRGGRIVGAAGAGLRGKILILVLLGFTATDFVLTRTFLRQPPPQSI